MQSEISQADIEWARNVARSVAKRLPFRFSLDDLEQEAVIAAWKARSKYDPTRNDKFEGYAYLAVRGAVLMSVRRRRWTDESGEEIPAQCAAPSEPLDQRIDERKLLRLIWQDVLPALPARERLVILWLYAEGRTLRYIARRLQHTEASTSKLHHAAIDQIRSELRVRGALCRGWYA